MGAKKKTIVTERSFLLARQNDFENTTCKQNIIIYELKTIKKSLVILIYKDFFVLC